MKSIYAKDILARLIVIVDMLEIFIAENLGEKKPADLTISQVLILYWLYKQGGSLQASKMRDACYTGLNLAYNHKVLKKAKYLRRERVKGDLRCVLYTLTGKAKALAQEVEIIVKKMEAEVGDRFSAKDMRSMEEWLGLIGHDFHAIAPPMRNAI